MSGFPAEEGMRLSKRRKVTRFANEEATYA